MKTATLVLLVTAWLFSLVRAQETNPESSCVPAVTPADEVGEAAHVYLAFWAVVFEERAKSGVDPFPGTEIIPAAEKLCAEVVQKATAHRRKDIAEAATRLLDAFKYTRENMSLKPADRLKPKDEKLLGMYPKNAARVTDGYLLKGYLTANLRFARILGLATISEKEIQDMPDFDLASVLEGIENAGSGDADKNNIQDHIIVVKTDGSILFDGKKAKSDDEIKQAMLKCVTQAEKAGKKLRVTLKTDEQAKYARIVDVMNILSVAKVTNVTFEVESD
jgi:hypothetical protein